MQLIFEQAGFALGLAMSGLVLLLLLGTQVLDWYWILLLVAGGLAFGAWRVVRAIPPSYRLAQILDARLHLHDSISTAYFFERHGGDKAPDIVAIQRQQAERAAAGADAAAAFPYVVPKALYGAFGIALVAFGMFAVRYGITHTLDLRPSIAKIAFDTFANTRPEVAVEKKDPVRKPQEDQLQKLGLNTASPEADPNQIDPAANSLLSAANSDVSNARAESDAAKAKASAAQNERAAEPSENGDSSDQSTEDGFQQPRTGPNQQGDSQAKNDQQNGQSGGKASQDANSDNSLMNKMRDAVANLLNKLKTQSRGDSGRQMAQNGQSRSGQQKSDKPGQSAGRNKSEGAGSPGEQGEPRQSQGDQTQTAQGKSGDKAGQNQPSQDAKSGIGKEEGDKAAKLAEQLAAMGKISEILGKRAENMSGEVMVEVSSGSQQLRTPYSGRTASHADTGGEISRDEVPLIYRQYVQHYFEQIRQQPAGPQGSKSKGAPADLGASPSPKSKTKTNRFAEE